MIAGIAALRDDCADMSSSEVAVAPRRHRVLVTCLFAAGVLIGFFACFSVWVNRQALNTEDWTKTSSELIADPQIEGALSTYLVSQLYTSVDVEGDIRSALPTEVQGLAGPAAAGLRALADRVVPELLATTQVQEAWRRANRSAHKELLRILDGGSRAVSTNRGVVTLDLHELVAQLGNQLGIEKQVAAAQAKLQGTAGATARGTVEQKLGVTLPPTSGQLVIMRSNELRTAQDIATAIRGLAIVLPLISILLFALGVWLAEGWRRVALRTTGWCIFGIGLLLVVARRVAGDQIVNGLVAIPANRPAAHAVWSIGTSLLYDLALAMIVYGLVFVAAAWLAGSTRPARFIRAALAPLLREHAVGSYAVAEAVLLLIVLWGPTPASRQALPVLGIAVLVALGVRLIRRQTAAEFPDAQAGEAMAAVRERIHDMRARRGAHERPPPGAARPDGRAGGDTRLEALERLTALHERGALTDEEFASEKGIVLGGR